MSKHSLQRLTASPAVGVASRTLAAVFGGLLLNGAPKSLYAEISHDLCKEGLSMSGRIFIKKERTLVPGINFSIIEVPRSRWS